MPSIYQQALGSDFDKLHPRIQQRFGFASGDGVASVGYGVMDEIWRGPNFTLPFLYVGAWRRIMFPERGHDIPFTVQNHAYLDRFGRETVTWIRTFMGRIRRRFDAYMIYSRQRGCIVDYLGSHQHLAVDLDLSVDRRGGLRIRSGAQRLYEGLLGFSFPLCLSGVADVCEWYDEEQGTFRVEVSVANRTCGGLFGYRGRFNAVWKKTMPGEMPADLRPLREERRE